MTPLRVARAERAAQDIHLFELRDPEGGALAPFTAGSHLRVKVPSGAIRKYSLCNDPAEIERYVIAVKRDPAGRGGSVSLVDGTRAGDRLEVSPPENAFALDEKAPAFLLIAGGIGITPLMAMARRLVALDARFRLVYCTRSPAHTAFAQELAADPLRSRVRIHHDGGDPAKALDLWPYFEKPTREHV